MNLVDELHAISAALGAARIEHAVCGGVAVTMHGATRSTKDIDILLRPNDVERALEAVRPLGYLFAAFPMVFEEGSPRERHVQRVSKIVGDQHLAVDFILAQASLSGLRADRIKVELPEGTVWVVFREALLQMKRMAGRPQDLVDIENLEHGDE